MSQYPTTFAETHTPLDLYGLDELGREALISLQKQGFEVVSGIQREDVPEVTAIAGQTAVREFCRNDMDTRFGDEPMVERWLQKKGGRGMFLLRRLGNIAGYGWTGAEECEEIPGSETTFAVRVNDKFSGQRLATPFTTVIVSDSVARFGASNISLETWGSNTKAVKAYLRAGADLVTTADAWRPTLKIEEAGVVFDAENGYYKRRDVRQFMQFTRTFRRND
jgi:hypothetical protein